jgi:hypothetical protein
MGTTSHFRPEIPHHDLPNGRFFPYKAGFPLLPLLPRSAEFQGTRFFGFVRVNASQRRSTNLAKEKSIMGKTKARDLMMLSVEKAAQINLATLVTEGKSQSDITWLGSRLKSSAISRQIPGGTTSSCRN